MDYIYDTNWIYAKNENGDIIAEVTFPNVREGVVSINHTFVDDSLRGRGVAGELLEAADKTIREAGKKAIPTCAYAVKWYESHPEKTDVVIER
jgi:predicted GNAT family acetyltransferase